MQNIYLCVKNIRCETGIQKWSGYSIHEYAGLLAVIIHMAWAGISPAPQACTSTPLWGLELRHQPVLQRSSRGTQAHRGQGETTTFVAPPHQCCWFGLGAQQLVALPHQWQQVHKRLLSVKWTKQAPRVPLWHCWGSGVVEILGPPLTVIDHRCNRLSFLLLSIPREQLQQGHSSLWRFPGVGWDLLKGDRSRREARRGLCGNMIHFFQHHSLSLRGIDEGWKACGQIIWPERLFCWIWDKLFLCIETSFMSILTLRFGGQSVVTMLEPEVKIACL